MPKHLFVFVVFSVLINVTRGECPMLTPCSQTHAVALSSLTSGPPDCSALQSFINCVRSCLSSDQTVLNLSLWIKHVCDGQLPQRTPDMEQSLQHIVSWFANGTSLHLNAEDLRLLLNCSAVSACVPQNMSSLSGEDTCNVAGSLYKCVHAALTSCAAPDAVRTFLASEKQEIDHLCNSGYRTVLPSLFLSLDDGLTALSSPGCVELMRCTVEGQSLGPPPKDKEAFCTNIKIVNTCIDESKDKCAVSSQFRSFINRYRHEESKHCHSGVGLQSITPTLLFLTATVTMATRHFL
ncbi:uncharacterized protein LOC124259489 isoform X2 [Haliotis rubra]|uniref:uncharacterized protein LOC124259489 isoform X2 n=1 Tax=Haliotis rubra TaxID=36100 RepID=UPI001EE50247|nr:uncharacterized protein LOC124259489 isoform X2 [Haliotis rubra]